MLITIVTPSFKRPDFLNQTIESVLSQEGDFELEYIVQDGGGCKLTKEIIEKKITSSLLAKYASKRKMFAYFEKDNGMYSAINRAFSRSSGEIMGWINSDDMYHPFALDTVRRIFQSYPDVDWITGIPNSYNKFSAMTGFDTFPNAYSQKFIAEGFYDVKFIDHGLNWIQQESTFWRRGLWDKAGTLNEELKYASDFFLWKNFALHSDLVKVYTFLGGFRVHEKQFTADPNRYRSELPVFTPPKGLKKLYDIVSKNKYEYTKHLDFNDIAVKKLSDDFGLNREHLTGRTIKWNYSENVWKIYWDLIL